MKYVTELARAKSFYEHLLDAEIPPLTNPTGNDEEMLAIPRQGGMGDYGATGALVKSNSRQPSANGTLVYFGCDDCAAMLDRTEAAGGKRVQEKTSLGDSGNFALAQDSEGNMIGFHSNN